MDAKHLRALYGAKIAEAKELGKDWAGKEEQMPAETVALIDAKLKEAEALQKRLDQALAIEAADRYQNEPEQTAASVAAGAQWRESLPTEGLPADGVGVRVDWKSGELYGDSKRAEAKVAALKSGQYKDALNHYLRYRAGVEKYRPNPDQVKVLQEGVDTSGGFWVTPDFRQEMVKKLPTMAVLRPNVRSFTTGKDLVSFPKTVYTTDDNYTSGVAFSWTAEAPAADISEATNPAAGRVNIPIHTATAAIIVTRAMMEDGDFDLMGFVNELLTEAFILGNENVIASGTGSGQPQGIYNHANAATAHASGGMQVLSGVSSVLAWGNGSTTGILGTEASLPPQYEANAAWYGRKASFGSIRALNLTTAGIQWSLGDSYPNAANGFSPSLLGYPIRKTQFAEAIGSSGRPLIFGDLQGYYLPERVGISIDVLRELRALRDEVVVYARQRIGGQLVHDWRVKLLKSHNS